MDEQSPTDAELVAAVLAGDREAFGQLYDRTARLVRAVVAGVSGDWPATEDMTQECFLRAYKKLASLRDPTRFGHWIVGIARQVGRERRRARHRDRHKFGDQPTLNKTISNQQQRLEESEELSRVMQCLAELTESERIAIHAHFLDQQNAQHTAEVLGLSRSGFYALLHRAVASLVARLKSTEAVERTGK